MNISPNYTYTQMVKVVSSDETTINSTIANQSVYDWSLADLIDKPSSNQVYLIFTKLVSSINGI